MRQLVASIAIALGCGGCFTTWYVGQAAVGQGDLIKRARPVSEVIADPNTSERTRRLLIEVGHVRDWARARGMKLSGNYTHYVHLDRAAAVWIVTAAKRLQLEAVTWSFPIVGSFPMLGWFDIMDAVRFRKRMERKGYDAYMRGAAAFSTGGWFADPIVSTMLEDGEDALGQLVNVVIHETVHATILLKHQQYFNESLAKFMGDEMTLVYLAKRYGSASLPYVAYATALRKERARAKRVLQSYDQLHALFESKRSDAEKLRRKEEIYDALERDLTLARRPNNAMLIGFRLYHVGYQQFRRLFAVCGRNWKRFRGAVGSVKTSWFDKKHQDDIAPILKRAQGFCVR